MRCPACGMEVIEQSVFCHKCGERLDALGNTDPVRLMPEADPKAAAAGLSPAAAGRNDVPQTEQELWRGGYSPKAMLGAWVISAAISLVLLIGGILWARDFGWWLALLVAMLLPWLYHAAVLLHHRLGVHYLLTSQRFIHEKGILRRVNDRVELLDMDDVTFEQGLLERLVGVGTIRIGSHDRTDPELALAGIEDVKLVANLLDNARLAERRRRGVHIEQI